MMASRLVRFARQTASRPPGAVLRRAWQEVDRQARRPWNRMRPRWLDDRSLLRRNGAISIAALWDDLARRPFFLNAADAERWAPAFSASFPDEQERIITEAEAILRHEFDLLGSGPCALGTPIPWHLDFKSGARWPVRYSHDIDYNELDRPSDVKVPWELSRGQHLVRLGQAWWLTGDERFASEFTSEIDDWISANPFSYGVNWACAMDVALRAVSWIWAFHFFATSEACSQPAFRGRFLRALFLHGEFLNANVERADVNGNHYLCDGVGLLFLGTFFAESRQGRRWMSSGVSIVNEAILEQVEEDGVDFEQSVAYHRLVLEALVTSSLLMQRNGIAVPDHAWARLERMFEYVEAYTKPDGRAPLIGDADDGRIQKLGMQDVGDHRYLLSTGAVLFDSPDFKRTAGRYWDETFWMLGPDAAATLEAIGTASSPESVAFPRGGIYVMRDSHVHAIVDAAEVGMHGRGGHGHNDVLSFELALGGENVVTDCGAYLYTASPEWRNRFRGTAFHNTVQVDGEELNRLVSPRDLWRLQYDARVIDVRWEPGPAVDRLAAAHTGYRRLNPPVEHRRELLLDRGAATLRIVDLLAGTGRHTLTSRFHLDPSVSGTLDGMSAMLRLPAGSVVFRVTRHPPGARLTIEPGWVSPRYGMKQPTEVLTVHCEGALPVTLAYEFVHQPAGDQEQRT